MGFLYNKKRTILNAHFRNVFVTVLGLKPVLCFGAWMCGPFSVWLCNDDDIDDIWRWRVIASDYGGSVEVMISILTLLCRGGWMMMNDY